MKVGILTFFRPINNGAVLQACATNRIISEKIGINSQLIDYRLTKTEQSRKPFNIKIVLQQKGVRSKISLFLKYIILLIPSIIRKNKFDKFINKHLNVTEKSYDSFESLKNAQFDFDTYIVGSDLVWNPQMTDGINPVFYLGFANGKKISYAASVGTTSVEEDTIKKIAKMAEGLDCISVREKSTAQMLQKYTDKEINIVLDPTLLTTKDDWNEFYSDKPIYKRKYIFAFSLQSSKLLIEQVNLLAKEYDCDIITCDLKSGYKARCVKRVYCMDPSEFLNYLKYAKAVVTNSFHGCAFSVVFNKEFYCIPHSERGIRMIDLLNSLGLDKKIVIDNPVLNDAISYIDVNEKLEKLMASSMDYLKNSIKGNDDE